MWLDGLGRASVSPAKRAFPFSGHRRDGGGRSAVLLLLPAFALLMGGCAGLAPRRELQAVAGPGVPWLGIIGRGTPGGGLRVSDLYVGSPAEEAGIERGDVVVAVEGRPATAARLAAALARRRPGDVLALTIEHINEVTEIASDRGVRRVPPGEFWKRYRTLVEGGRPGRLGFRVAREARVRTVSVPLAEPPLRVRPEPLIAALPRKGGAGWLGVGIVPADDLATYGVPAGTLGLRVVTVSPGSPAEKAGIRTGDVIVRYGGHSVFGDPDGRRDRFTAFVRDAGSGSRLALTVLRLASEVTVSEDGTRRKLPAAGLPGAVSRIKPGGELGGVAVSAPKLVDLEVTLGARAAWGPAPPALAPAEEAARRPAAPAPPLEELALKVLGEVGFRGGYDDLLTRLADDEAWDDGLRLPGVHALKRDPFRIPEVSEGLLSGLRAVAGDPAALVRLLANELPQQEPGGTAADAFPLRTGLSPEEHCAQFERLLDAADRYREKAFAGLTQGDLEFLHANLIGFSQRWARDRTLSEPDGLEVERRVLALLGYVDYSALFDAAEVVASALSPDFLRGVKADLERAGGSGIVASRETPFGRIILSGRGNSRYLQPAAVIVDLAGDDFYSVGAASGSGLPFSVIIDFGGDDRYSSSAPGAQGTGILGVGLLADLEGDDTYLGGTWAQGSGLAGVGILLDSGGRDTYRAGELAQGAALFGLGILVDRGADDDAYRADRMAQGFAGPGGAGLLLDEAGDDRYFASGRYPSGYAGDTGTFDGWAQGCGTGIRSRVDPSLSRSGGVGILLDGGGDDRYEAGTFSQGGGYFFGWGMLLDAGTGDDDYLGTRYAQGFAAHSSVGYFEDQGGDDRYRALVGAHAGASWDLSAVAFVDRGGDDRYEGGFFSLGASAHNGFCVFTDLGGADSYLGSSPGAAGPNSYHGGSSLSVFLDAGPESDVCPACPPSSAADHRDTIVVDPAYRVFVRTDRTVRALLLADRWKSVIASRPNRRSSSEAPAVK